LNINFLAIRYTLQSLCHPDSEAHPRLKPVIIKQVFIRKCNMAMLNQVHEGLFGTGRLVVRQVSIREIEITPA
jgi:hypothetical protein